MLRPKVVFQPIHEDVVRRRFKNHLSGQTSDMMDDIKYAVDQVWGMNESQYKSVNLDGTIRTIIARVSNRALIGLPMCMSDLHLIDCFLHYLKKCTLGRDPGFINNAIRYVNEIPLVALMIKLLPGLLQAIVAKILTFKIRHYYTCCAQYLRPLFAERLELGHADPASLPEDYASWSVLDAIKRKQKDERTPDMLSRRLMTLNFAVIHTSTMTTSNLILDIVSAPYCIKDILKECQKLQQKFGLEWSPSRISEMATLDSALRESMRISGFGSKAFSRKVIAPNGVNLPNGVHLPRGVIVCVSGYSLHHDETIYPEPYQFSYRRFAPTATDPEADKSSREIATTTSLNYAVWGHGKHACPGRFFAVDMIKMVVAYMISHYEIKSFLKRPENVWIADTPIPPSNTFIEIRRRFENEIEIV